MTSDWETALKALHETTCACERLKTELEQAMHEKPRGGELYDLEDARVLIEKADGLAAEMLAHIRAARALTAYATGHRKE